MTLLNTINVGNTDFGLLNATVMGVCSTPAGSEVKVCAFADNFELKAGIVVTIKFTYANTYGDGSTTYPKLSVNGITGAIRNVTGEYASNGAWSNQALVPLLFDGTDFTLLISNVTDTVASDNKYSVSSKGVADALDRIHVLERGVYAPFMIAGNSYAFQEILLQHTYKFTGTISFQITPVSYEDTAYVYATAHWLGHGEDSTGASQGDRITVYLTNAYNADQMCGFYWEIVGKDSDIAD